MSSSSLNKAIFFDRDGVINFGKIIEGKSYPPQNLDEFRYCDGIKQLCTYLKDQGFKLIICTNQPDVRTGKQTEKMVNLFHQKITQDLKVDDIYACFHVDEDQCSCRKPKPGMLTQAQKKWNIDFQESYLIGDRWKDIEAGQIVGCKTIFVDYQLKEQKPDSPDYIVYNTEEILDIFKKELS